MATRRRLSSFFAAAAVSMTAGMLPAQDTISPDTVEHIAESSVFVRVERVFKYEDVPSSGSGFFIHPDGYIMTNWHVVADQIASFLWQREREVNAKVIGLAAVVNSGQRTERELPAKIVARDRERDLALLKVNYRPKTFLKIDTVDDVRLGERIWSAGFPYGELLAMEKQVNQQDMPNPEVSLTSGMVTSLRRDAKGELTMVQTDAALNPGSSGSAIVNADGHLVGVVVAGIQGGEGLGFGIAPNQVREFISRQAIQIDIEPSVVLSPPQPIRVTVRPVLVELGQGTGTAKISGGDIDSTSFDFTQSADGLEATVVFPERIPGRNQPARYNLTVTLDTKISGEKVVRRFSLDAVPESFQKLSSARDPGEMMEDRKVLAHEMSIEDYNKSRQVNAGSSKKSLSDVARSKKLKTDASGRVVVDNRTVDDIGAPSVDESRYRLIDDPTLRADLKRYDRVASELDQLQDRFRSTSRDPYAYQYRSTLSRQITAKQREKGQLGRQISGSKVRQCRDTELYFIARGGSDSYPCELHHTVY
jgi:hypothetical protein